MERIKEFKGKGECTQLVAFQCARSASLFLFRALPRLSTNDPIHGRVMDLVFSGQAGDGSTSLAFPPCAFHLRSRQLTIPATLLKLMATTEVCTIQ
jgi:hypothetical protein